MLPGCVDSARLGQLLGIKQLKYLECDVQWEERERVTTTRRAEMVKTVTVRGRWGQLRSNVVKLNSPKMRKQGSNHPCHLCF